MTFTLVCLSVIMATVVWWLVRQTLNVSPWVEQNASAGLNNGDGFTLPSIKIGLCVFLAVATSLFALSISAYLMRREGADWQHLAPPWVLWLNTAVLILASICFQRASHAAKSKHPSGVRRDLLAGGGFTLVFLAGQLWAWQQLHDAGYFLTSNPANAFFYMLTALHGAHLLGGLWVWVKTAARAHAGAASDDVRLSVELCTLYWHFLLVVWLVLFGLLSFT
jgi:cytochrome c oxidase subunit 3